MEFETKWFLAMLGLLVLAILLTGPGMWSSTWGWKTLERLFQKRNKR